MSIQESTLSRDHGVHSPAGAVEAERRWRKRISGLLGTVMKAEVLAVIEIGLVLPAALAYCTSADEKIRERHYQAWQVIAAWNGKTGDGGRIDALEDLNRDRVPLRGVEVAGAYLDSVWLAGADMKHARLENATLKGADLTGVFLARSTATHADLNGARAPDADFVFASADTASFYGVTLCRTLFLGASLRRAHFGAAVLDSADFRGADLRGAVFSGDTVPPGTRFDGANVAGVTPARFALAAVARGAVLEPDSARWEARRASIDIALKKLWVRADTIRRSRLENESPARLQCEARPARGT